MGIFDKLFGGTGRADDTNAPAQPTATPAPSPSPDGPVPARRERSKPGAAPSDPPAPSAASHSDGERLAENFSDQTIGVPSLPLDGENVPLLTAIHEVVTADGPDSRATLYEAILSAELYLVSMGGEDDLGTGELTLQEGQQLSLATIRDPEGRTFLPAFTDLARLSASLPEKGRYLRIGAAAICRMFLQGGGEGIVINPGQPPSGVITRGEAEILANNVAPQFDDSGQMTAAVPQQMRIAIGKPEATPAESFVSAIRDEAAKHAIVREVHLFMAGIEEQPPRLMIGLLVDEGLAPEQMHPAFEAIGKAAYDARGESEAFDMMPLNEQMIEAIRPTEGIIYSRDQQV